MMLHCSPIDVCHLQHVLMNERCLLFCHLSRVIVKFVIGSEPCLLPVDDRLSAQSCDEWKVTVPGQYLLCYWGQ